jgi:quercetin dioxygenase-like cupin family protein
MAVDLYQPFTNTVTGETFRCLSSTEEAYITEWVVQPAGFVPFEHIHPNQDEIFHVKQGEMRAVIDGREYIAAAGQTVTVPRGARHIAANNRPEVLACVLEYRPALDSYQVFQCFGGLSRDNDTDRRGIVNIPKMMYFLQRINARTLARPSYVPAPLFSLAMRIFYVLGVLAGWEKLYKKYTG